MEKHDYLNLKLGNIKQYSMVIKKKDLPYWKKLHWKEYKEIGLPAGDEDVSSLYGMLKKTTETLIFNRPVLLKDVQKETLVGKTILGLNLNLGTYGMGNTDFFGLLLDNDDYLVYSVWNAGYFSFIDDKIVKCSPRCYYRVKSWISDVPNLIWDDLTKHIVNSKIIDYTIEDEVFTLIVKKNRKKIEIRFVRNEKKIPRSVARFRNAYKYGSIGDYILFQHKDATLVV
jgi:hypothetical protein